MDEVQKIIDREFIRNENKSEISYEEVKDVGFSVLLDFKRELNIRLLLKLSCVNNDVKLLNSLIKLMDSKDLLDNNLLRIACKHKYYDCLKALIESGININPGGLILAITPLMQSCIGNSYKCVKLLVDAGVDVNEKSMFGGLPLAYSLGHSRDKRIIDLLIENGAHE